MTPLTARPATVRYATIRYPAFRRLVSVRRLVLPLAAAALLASCDSADPAPEPVAPPSTGCPGSGVLLRTGRVAATVGLRTLTIELVNCGGRSYTVRGYPAVRVLDADRKPLDVRIGQGLSALAPPPPGAGAPPGQPPASPEPAPRPVTLRPGETATATLSWRNAVTNPTVAATTGAYLEVAPAAGQAAEVLTPSGGRGIDLGTTRTLAVRPWTARPPG